MVLMHIELKYETASAWHHEGAYAPHDPVGLPYEAKAMLVMNAPEPQLKEAVPPSDTSAQTTKRGKFVFELLAFDV